MKKSIFVRATNAEAPCPMYPRKGRRMYTFDESTGERRDRSQIYADEVVEVPNIRFYRRRILKGDLLEVDPAMSDERLRIEGTDDEKGD